ncbi:glycosyltransferase family protein [Luteimonas salinilitoris]|uniref:Glycosyltransferase n=1 Tax=Luteimonas salinilitoris TaxID=3237697 RepID=A0ABV4HU70_9GAMM
MNPSAQFDKAEGSLGGSDRKMRIAIKNPSPIGPNMKLWGDYHFGKSLQRALEDRGASVEQHYWPEWDKGRDADAVIVLRGKRRYFPKPGELSVLWVISHPAAISIDEIDAYTVVCPASETHLRALEGATNVPLSLMPQCTDTKLFSLPEKDVLDDIESRRGVIFVASCRSVRREMMQWAMNVGMRPELIGRSWQQFGLQDLVQREYVDNAELPALYRSYRLSLNDHWGDMQYFGIINNRVFDCLASGLPVLSDSFSELREVCGDGVMYASNEREYWDAMWRCKLRYREIIENARLCWERLKSTYTFDHRAGQIIDLLENPPARKGKATSGDHEDDERNAVYAKFVSDMFPRRKGRAKRVLHVFPSPQGARCLINCDRVNYLSAGIGLGPWEASLGVGVEQLRRQSFDVIVIDEHFMEKRIKGHELQLFVAGMHAARDTSGVICLIQEQGTDRWRDWVASLKLQGLVEISRKRGYAVYGIPDEYVPTDAGKERK